MNPLIDSQKYALLRASASNHKNDRNSKKYGKNLEKALINKTDTTSQLIYISRPQEEEKYI
jgi:hypothetical protein